MYWFGVFVVFLGLAVSMFFLLRTLLTLFTYLKDSPFVPSRKIFFKQGLTSLEITEGDRFLDIGCGDGRVVTYCANHHPGADLYKGIDIIFLLILFAKFRRLFSKYKSKIFFEKKDATDYDYSSYNKIFMYLLPDFVCKLMEKLERELPSKSIVISAVFAIPDIYKRSGNLSVKEVKVGIKTKKLYIWKKK